MALLLAAGSPAGASAPELFGYGARSAAMAGTGVADADGYDAVWANPSGLVEPTRRRLTLGYVFGSSRLHLDGAPHPVDDVSGVILGAALPLPFRGVLAGRLAVGLGFYFPTSVLNRARAPYPNEARLALLDVRAQVVSGMAALGIRIHPRFTVGIGLSALAALVGDVRIAPDSGGHLIALAEEQIVVAYTPIVGARVRVLDSLRLGAVFRGVSKASYDIRIATDFGQLVPLKLPVLHVAGVAQYDPMQAALEAAWRPLDGGRFGLGLSGGLTWKRWSAFPLPTENASAGAPKQPPPGFHDTVVPRIAVELDRRHGPLLVHGRAGYFFEWSPAPSSASSALVDADRHVVTAGAGLEWAHRYGVLQVDLFGQLHALSGSPRAGGTLFLVGATIGVDL